MNLIFFGSDQYSLIVLKELVTSSYQPVVVTDLRHDNPLIPFATEHSLRVIDYRDITALPPASLGILASFGHILKGATITHFGRGILCLHPSLLPQYRGATPVPHAIALGETETGITLFRLNEKIDDGEILVQVTEPILASDTSPALLTRLFTKGAELLLSHLSDNPIRYTKYDIQNTDLIFTRRLTRESGYIEWPVIQKLIANQSPESMSTNNSLLQHRLLKEKTANIKITNYKLILIDLVRSLTPWPGVWTIADTKKGPLRISLIPQIINNNYTLQILISGKPNPISWSDFSEYYL